MPSFFEKIKGIRKLGDIGEILGKKEEGRGKEILESMKRAEEESIVKPEEKPVELASPTEAELGLRGAGAEAEAGVEKLGAIPPEGVLERLEGVSFSIDLRPRIIELPPFKDTSKINIRYPVMPPYAYAHIFWDKKSNELVYFMEEPELTKVEKNLLRLIQLGLEEMLNVSFIRATKSNLIMQYLEKNVQSILIELGTKVTKEAYFKIMYFVSRDSIGLNEIEPLLNDYFIEDIECNGQGFPVYI